MPPNRSQHSNMAGGLNTAYSLELLSEYTHTLDSLPIDLSRNFTDLRELDAVLASSMSSLTSKVLALTKVIEDGIAPAQGLLWLLTEITEDASKLKPGGEDKIRVSSQAADNVLSHFHHLKALTERIPGFEPNSLERHTIYPHVATKSYMTMPSTDTRSRRRGAAAAAASTSLLVNVTDQSPHKRKRPVRDEDHEMRSPRREQKVIEKGRNGGRGAKMCVFIPFPLLLWLINLTYLSIRGASPTESMMSVSAPVYNHSHPHQTSSRNNAQYDRSRATNGSAAGAHNKRSRNGAPRAHSPSADFYGSPAYDTSTSRASAPRGSRDAYNIPLSSTHPSLPSTYNNGNGRQGTYEDSDWAGGKARQLEGPGMPIARSAVSTNINNEDSSAANGEMQADDPDETLYCYCGRASFGDMVACDNDNCKIEWVSLKILFKRSTTYTDDMASLVPFDMYGIGYHSGPRREVVLQGLPAQRDYR